MQGPQDASMRALISLALRSLAGKDTNTDALENDALSLARNFLHDAVGDRQDDTNAARAADRAAVLAIVRSAVAAGYDRAQARAAAARAYHTPRGAALGAWDSVLKAEDPVGVLQKGSLSNTLRRGYGDSMQGHDESGPDHTDLVITTCAYNDFFRKAGEPDLTFIFCTADWSWMDSINASARPIAIERPTTLSTGGSACRFRFVRSDPARKSDTDIVRSRPESRFDPPSA